MGGLACSVNCQSPADGILGAVVSKLIYDRFALGVAGAKFLLPSHYPKCDCVTFILEKCSD